ncbi:MAG: UpxY family transcription antiterminator [Candidatus Acidiferrum sp.]|jgi:transcription antitermination factor NusG
MSATARPLARYKEQADSQRNLTEIHWYAAYTGANREKKVAAQLSRRSVEFFLPKYHSVRHWKDRRVELDLPLFAGYIFVHVALCERLQVLQVPGVVRLVGFGNCATPVPDIEISRVRAILNHGLRTDPHPYLSTGQRVRVKDGPFTGLEGFIVRRKNITRFVVTIELIRRAVSVEVSEFELETSIEKTR